MTLQVNDFTGFGPIPIKLFIFGILRALQVQLNQFGDSMFSSLVKQEEIVGYGK